jgi:hypothetical protein
MPGIFEIKIPWGYKFLHRGYLQCNLGSQNGNVKNMDTQQIARTAATAYDTGNTEILEELKYHFESLRDPEEVQKAFYAIWNAKGDPNGMSMLPYVKWMHGHFVDHFLEVGFGVNLSDPDVRGVPEGRRKFGNPPRVR